MIDLDAAIGFVVAHADPVERARLTRLLTGATPPEELLADAETRQAPNGGWPPLWAVEAASVDATCFRLAELDDLGALDRPAARKALNWLAGRQRSDGFWEEDVALADCAPSWARPGDPEARLYLTASAAFWLTVANLDARTAGNLDHGPGGPYAGEMHAAAQTLAWQIQPDGTWPSYLAVGWLSGAIFFRQDMFTEWARVQAVLAERIPKMSPSDVAWLASTLRRVGVPDHDWTLVAARRRLAATQRSDGGWDSDEGSQFDVYTALRVIRAYR